MKFISSLFRAFRSASVKVHKRPGKIGAINAWKVGKKASGKWLPHDQYVKLKKGKR